MGPDGQDNTVLPYIMAEKGVAVGSLMNRLGAPHSVPFLKVSALPARVYNLIYNEFYRNEWLQDPVPISKADGLDTTTNLNLLRACWERDYFTQAQPSPQKGPDVSIGLGATAPVRSNGQYPAFKDDKTGSVDESVLLTRDGPDNKVFLGLSDVRGPNFGEHGVYFGSQTGLEADLSAASSITVNALRYASAVQQFQEANALTGNRYPEFIPTMYGCYCPDSSLQRPQYIGGLKSPMVISEVL